MDGLDRAASTKKLRLAALRHFFDTPVKRDVVVLNRPASVRGERLQVVEGTWLKIIVEQARRLIRRIDTRSVVSRFAPATNCTK